MRIGCTRNTLRLEAKMALYGHEISDTINVWESGLERYCKMDKGDFLGRAGLEKAWAAGVTRTLVGLEMVERGIARDGYRMVDENGNAIGVVTSGSPSPTLCKNIALAYVPPEKAEIGTATYVEIRGQRVQGAGGGDTPLQKGYVRPARSKKRISAAKTGKFATRSDDMAYPTQYRYTKEHEWIEAKGAAATIGITDYAQHELGDVVLVELPKVGAALTAGKTFSSVESVKAVSEIYAPANGQVTEGERDIARQARDDQQRPTRRGMAGEDKAGEPGRRERVDGRGGV